MARRYLSASRRAAKCGPNQLQPAPLSGTKGPENSHNQGFPGGRAPKLERSGRRGPGPAARLAVLVAPLSAVSMVAVPGAGAAGYPAARLMVSHLRAPLAHLQGPSAPPATTTRPYPAVPRAAANLLARFAVHGWRGPQLQKAVAARLALSPPTQAATSHHRDAQALAGPAPAPAPRPVRSYLGAFLVTCYDLTGATASGDLAGLQSVAVDPQVIPLGTEIYVQGVGERTADDTGGAIIGNHIDIWEPTYTACADWGVRERAIYRVGGAE